MSNDIHIHQGSNPDKSGVYVIGRNDVPFGILMDWAYRYGIAVSTDPYVPGMVLRYEIDGDPVCENWELSEIPQKIVSIVRAKLSGERADEVRHTAAVLWKEQSELMAARQAKYAALGIELEPYGNWYQQQMEKFMLEDKPQTTKI